MLLSNKGVCTYGKVAISNTHVRTAKETTQNRSVRDIFPICVVVRMGVHSTVCATE